MRTAKEVLQRADVLIRDSLREELHKQGHYLTGALEKSIQGTVTSAGNMEVLTGVARAYGHILHYGTKPSRIPYGGQGKSTGGTSKYIQGLKDFFIQRGLSEQEALGAAFATAKKQKKEGMSTEGSKQYSSTGERQGFIGIVATAIGQQVDNLVLSGFDQLINQTFLSTKSETV